MAWVEQLILCAFNICTMRSNYFLYPRVHNTVEEYYDGNLYRSYNVLANHQWFPVVHVGATRQGRFQDCWKGGGLDGWNLLYHDIAPHTQNRVFCF